MIYQKGHLARPLDAVLAPPARLAVLRALHHAPEGLTGRWVARRAGLSPQSALDALKRLQALRLVESRESGRSLVWRTSRGAWLHRRVLAPLFAAEAELAPRLVERVKEELRGLCEQVLLEGRLAAGKLAPGGHFTMVLVCETARRRRLTEATRILRAEFWQEHGLVLAAVVLTRREAEVRPGLADAWRLLPDEGRGFVYGTRTAAQRK